MSNDKKMTDKIIPLRIARKKGLIKSNEKELIKFSTISLILVSLALAIECYITMKYLGTDPYANYSLLLVFLGFIGVTGSYWMNPDLFSRNDHYLTNSTQSLKFMSYILGVMAMTGVMMFSLQASFRLALSTSDLYLYHLASAIIEELFFRMFLINFFNKMFNKKYNFTIFSIIFSSLLFGLAHVLSGYGIELIIAMFFGGLIFSMAYLFSRDITVPMLAHAFINIIVVGIMVYNAGGV